MRVLEDIPTPLAPTPLTGAAPYVGHDLLTRPGTPNHVVQFYESDEFLAEVVADFLVAGGRRGEPMLVIATEAHRVAVLEALQRKGLDVPGALQCGELTVLDARATLERLLVDGMPDPARFEQTVGGALAACASRACGAPVRAYGEMVDLLWRDGNAPAALRLEQLWNALAGQRPFSLLCAYALSGFSDGAHAGPFEGLCAAHSHVLPTEAFTRLQEPDARLREVSQLQQRALALEAEIARRERVEQELREALLTREDFLSIAGHELKTPLTALSLQLQALWAATPAVRERVEVALRQSRRLHALVEELLDVSHLAARPLVLSPEPLDLAALVRDVVKAQDCAAGRLQVPLRVYAGQAIHGCWDRARLEQVVSGLLSNALKYGRGQPVDVTVAARGQRALLSVRDRGIGIAPEAQARVFERFERAVSSQHYGGLGLGLWVCRQIVEAHGGAIRIENAPDRGACVSVELPRQ